jgi:hypothetical protein
MRLRQQTLFHQHRGMVVGIEERPAPSSFQST